MAKVVGAGNGVVRGQGMAWPGAGRPGDGGWHGGVLSDQLQITPGDD